MSAGWTVRVRTPEGDVHLEHLADAADEWFHASRSANRESIARHGLNWRRMATLGIAGSHRPEYPGIFLCAMRGRALVHRDDPRRAGGHLSSAVRLVERDLVTSRG